MGFADSQLRSSLTKTAAVSFAADDTGFRMLGDHQSNNIPSVTDQSFAVGADFHVCCRRGDTGGHQTAGVFVFYQAHAAGTVWF